MVSGIASAARRHWVELLWGAFALANVVVIVLLAAWETIPFHLVWVSLTLLYGYRVWSGRTTALLLVMVVVVTGSALAFSVVRSSERLDEMAEVPLMAAMFLAMVWQARRRQAAVEDARRMAETEHRLRERQREFVRDASHELRTPITIARGHAELVRSTSSDPRVVSDVEIVVDELARLSRLSERLLVLAAAEHVELTETRPVDVRALVEDAGRRWRPAADRRWRILPHAFGSIDGDDDRLRVAVDALVENAVNATEAGGAITIAGRAQGDRFVLEVADDGPGIDPERLPRLFERFSRVDAPRGRGSGGTGLGLSIVKAITESHGGSVEVESHPGDGSAFRIVLPGLESQAAAGTRAPSSASVG